LSCSSLPSAFDHLATQLNGNSELLEDGTWRLEVDQTVATESETFNHAHLSDISDLEVMPEDFKQEGRKEGRHMPVCQAAARIWSSKFL
jgi:hypothetical protein